MKLLGVILWISLAVGAPDEAQPEARADPVVSYDADDTPWSPLSSIEDILPQMGGEAFSENIHERNDRGETTLASVKEDSETETPGYPPLEEETTVTADEVEEEGEASTTAPTTVAPASGPAWLEPLRRSVYLAIVRDRINRLIKLDLTGETPPADLWPSLEHAPLLGEDSLANGKIIQIKGRLIRTAAKDYVFQVDSESNTLDADAISDEDEDTQVDVGVGEETLATWGIRRVRRSERGSSRRELVLRVALGTGALDGPADTFTIKDPIPELPPTTTPQFFSDLPPSPPQDTTHSSRINPRGRKGKRPMGIGRPAPNAEPRGPRRPARTFWMQTSMFRSPPQPPRFVPMPPLPAHIAMMLASNRPAQTGPTSFLDQSTKHSQPKPTAAAPPGAVSTQTQTLQSQAAPRPTAPYHHYRAPHHHYKPAGPAPPPPQYGPWRPPAPTWYEIRPQHQRLPHHHPPPPPPQYTMYRPNAIPHPHQRHPTHYPLPHYPIKYTTAAPTTAAPSTTASTTTKPPTKKQRSKARSTTTTTPAPAPPGPSIPVPAPINVPYIDIEHIKPKDQQKDGHFLPSRPDWFSEPDPLQPPTVVLTLGDSIKRNNNTASYHLQLLVNNQTQNRFSRTTLRPPAATSSKPTSFPTVLPTYEELFMSKWDDQLFSKVPRTTTLEPTTIRPRYTTTTATTTTATAAPPTFDIITVADASFDTDDATYYTTPGSIAEISTEQPRPTYVPKTVAVTAPKEESPNIQKIVKKEKFTLNDAMTKSYYKYPIKPLHKLTIISAPKPVIKKFSPKSTAASASNIHPSSTARPTQRTKPTPSSYALKQADSSRKRLFAVRRGQDRKPADNNQSGTSVSVSSSSTSTSTTTERNYDAEFNDDDLSVTVTALTLTADDSDWPYTDQAEDSSNIIKGGQYELEPEDEGSVEPLLNEFDENGLEDTGFNVINDSKELLEESSNKSKEEQSNNTSSYSEASHEFSDSQNYYNEHGEANLDTGDVVEESPSKPPTPDEIPVTEYVNEIGDEIVTTTAESPVEINTKKSLVTSISLKVGKKPQLYTTPRYGDIYLDENFEWVEAASSTPHVVQKPQIARRRSSHRV